MLLKKKLKIIFIYLYIYIFSFLTIILFNNYNTHLLVKKNNEKFDLFYYKYYRTFVIFKFLYKKNIFKNNITTSINFYNHIFLYKFYFLFVFNIYNNFFKFFFPKFRSIFYAQKNNRIFYNLKIFNIVNYSNLFISLNIKNIFYRNLKLKKYVYDKVLSRRSLRVKKFLYYRRISSIIKRKYFKKIKKIPKFRNFIAKISYTRKLSKNYLVGVKRIFYGFDFYLKGGNYFLK